MWCSALSYRHTISNVDGAISTILDVSNHILYLKYFLRILCDLCCIHEGSYQWINDPKMCWVYIKKSQATSIWTVWKFHPKTCWENLVKEGGTIDPRNKQQLFRSPFYEIVIWGSFRMNRYTWSLLLEVHSSPLPVLGVVTESASNRI